MKREFYFQDDLSNKFWTIELAGNEYVTSHGRVGASLRETRKEFDDEATAQRECEKQIASKLKKGYLEGTAPTYKAPDWAALSMTEEIFWRITGLFNWKRLGDDDAVIEPAVKALAQMSVEDIQRFEEFMTEKLYALDTEAHAREIGDDTYEPGKYFSVDEFLYSRCCVVANGLAEWEAVLADPSEMPKDMEFEALLTLASTAYARKTGEEFDYSSELSYETFSNRAGWGNSEQE